MGRQSPVPGRSSATLSRGVPVSALGGPRPKKTAASGGHFPNDQSWCPGTESNCRHEDFQSTALPTELPRRTCPRAGAEYLAHLLGEEQAPGALLVTIPCGGPVAQSPVLSQGCEGAGGAVALSVERRLVGLLDEKGTLVWAELARWIETLPQLRQLGE